MLIDGPVRLRFTGLSLFSLLLIFGTASGNPTWNIERIRAPELWEEGITGDGVVIALLDSGVDYAHPDLEERIWTNPGEIPGNGIDDDKNGYVDDSLGWDFADGDRDPMDDIGHGTAVAGVICGGGNLGEITGAAPGASLMICRILHQGMAFEPDIFEAFHYALDNGALVVITTIGILFSPYSETWRAMTDRAIGQGVTLVYSAGSRSFPPPDAIVTPGNIPAAITASATDFDDNIAYFAARGPVEWSDYPHPPGLLKPDISAPGVNILTTDQNGGYAMYSGTAFAAAHMAGAAALLLQAHTGLDPLDVRGRYEQASIDRGDPGKDNVYGAGRIDCFASVFYEPPLSARFDPGCLAAAPGDSVSTVLTVTNISGETVDFRGWAEITAPWGEVPGSMTGPRDLSLRPERSIEAKIDWKIPVQAPPGEYRINARAENIHGQPPEWNYFLASFAVASAAVIIENP